MLTGTRFVTLMKHHSEVEGLTRAFIQYWTGDEASIWVLAKLFEYSEKKPQLALDVILLLLDRAPSEEVLGFVGAGPLQDLIAANGATAIDRIAHEAMTNPRLADSLNGIYRINTPDDVWRRIVQISERSRQMDNR
jgi:hypothetical protein